MAPPPFSAAGVDGDPAWVLDQSWKFSLVFRHNPKSSIAREGHLATPLYSWQGSTYHMRLWWVCTHTKAAFLSSTGNCKLSWRLSSIPSCYLGSLIQNQAISVALSKKCGRDLLVPFAWNEEGGMSFEHYDHIGSRSTFIIPRWTESFQIRLSENCQWDLYCRLQVGIFPEKGRRYPVVYTKKINEQKPTTKYKLL